MLVDDILIFSIHTALITIVHFGNRKNEHYKLKMMFVVIFSTISLIFYGVAMKKIDATYSLNYCGLCLELCSNK